MKSITRARSAFTRAEFGRIEAAQVYADLLAFYNSLRSNRDKRDVYPDVIQAYKELTRAINRRERAAAVLNEAEAEEEEEEILDDVRDGLRKAGEFPAGTEFELTATTKGGTPNRSRGDRKAQRKRRKAK